MANRPACWALSLSLFLLPRGAPAADPPVEPRPALLQFKFPSGGAGAERTVKLKSALELKTISKKKTQPMREDVEVDALETVKGELRGGSVLLYFGPASGKGGDDGKPSQYHPAAFSSLHQLPVTFALDTGGAFLGMTWATTTKVAPAAAIQKDLDDLYARVCDHYQSLCLALPNRTVKPQESWPAKITMTVAPKGSKKREVVGFNLTCTYEGTRLNAGRTEAVIRLGDAPGKAKGTAVFDLDAGYLTRAELSLNAEVDATTTTKIVAAQNLELTRTAGNVLKIAAPPPLPGGAAPAVAANPAGPVARGNILLSQRDSLAAKDPPDARMAGARCKVYPNTLSRGKKYIIEMNKLGGSKVDPVLRIEDAVGKVLAEDRDSGGGSNARIVFTAPHTTLYRIVATSQGQNQFGGFALIISEAAGP